MPLNQNDKEKLRKYGRVLSLEDSLRDTQINQDPRMLSNVLMGLGNDVIGDPLQALRRNPYDIASETSRYLGFNWNQEGGERISQIIENNQAEILETYARKVDTALQEAGNDKIKASRIAGKVILSLTPESLRQIKNASESEKRNRMYGIRAQNRPYLTSNTAFYEDASQATDLMVRTTGAEFLQSEGEGENIRYKIDRNKINEVFAENKKVYAIMASQMEEATEE